MITLIHALNFRCLRYASRTLGRFHFLLGENASGKTTFLDTIGFLGDLVSGDLDYAVTERTTNPIDLFYRREGDSFELAVEADVPHLLCKPNPDMNTVRYQIKIGFDNTQRQVEIKNETLLLKKGAKDGGARSSASKQRTDFPKVAFPPSSIQEKPRGNKVRVLFRRTPENNASYHRVSGYGKRGPSFMLNCGKSALRHFSADESSFPVATWFRNYLAEGIVRLSLDGRTMGRPSLPLRPLQTHADRMLPDGSNLSWVIENFQKGDTKRYAEWFASLRKMIPDCKSVRVVERPEDRSRYMIYEYANGVSVPAWMVSGGTLRITALALAACLPDRHRPTTLMIDNIENGISSDAMIHLVSLFFNNPSCQTLMETQLQHITAEESQCLLFAKDKDGVIDIASASELATHPYA